jgi:hypothetical protein
MESSRSPVAIAAVTSFVRQSLEKFGTNFSNKKVRKSVNCSLTATVKTKIYILKNHVL